ncbi:MAG: 2-iminoacetate synthase ThiH [Candidatus Omnitrophota bacterium]
MSYYDLLSQYRDRPWGSLVSGASRYRTEKAVHAESVTADQFALLLSQPAEQFLETMASRAHDLTMRNFGRTIQLYTPLYLSNYCDNRCVYCGFHADSGVARKRLTLEELEKEAACIASAGLKHILVLTGSSRKESPVSYIKDCVAILRNYFSSISIEIYAVTEAEYAEFIAASADGLTIYQEVYDEQTYAAMHPSGPKSDYRFRLDAPERGAKAGMRAVNIGVLFGLNDWRKEAFLMGLHAKYLQDRYPDVEIGASIPRIRPNAGGFKAPIRMSDRNMVQAIVALRLFLPRASITVSTRESPRFRENIIPLGITRMSAGSTTRVGGHTIEAPEGDEAFQFEISDERSVADIMAILTGKGYQPVLKDWMYL